MFSCSQVALSLVSLSLTAQQAPADETERELLALLNAPVTVASRKVGTLRDVPGVVTLVTRQEILDSGARDLIDVLRLVPGLDFGTDVQGVVDLGVRGMWGHEGKVLLLWDGLEMNETPFGTNLGDEIRGCNSSDPPTHAHPGPPQAGSRAAPGSS